MLIIPIYAKVSIDLLANFNKVAFWDNIDKTLFIKIDVADVSSAAALSDGTNADVAIVLNDTSDITALSDFLASNLILS